MVIDRTASDERADAVAFLRRMAADCEGLAGGAVAQGMLNAAANLLENGEHVGVLSASLEPDFFPRPSEFEEHDS